MWSSCRFVVLLGYLGWYDKEVYFFIYKKFVIYNVFFFCVIKFN